MAHSQLAKSAGLFLAAVTLMSAAYAADQTSVAVGTTSLDAAQVAAAQAQLNKNWIGLPVKDVAFFENNFLSGLKTIFQKVSAPLVPNTITPPIQHLSRATMNKPGTKAYTRELEEITQFVLRAIVSGDDGQQPTLKMITNPGGERLEFTGQDGKKQAGQYYAYNHDKLGVTKISCIGFIYANGEIQVLFTQSSAQKFSNCKGELVDLLNTLPIVQAEKSDKVSAAKALKTKKSVKTAVISE